MLGYSPAYPESAEPDEAYSLETLYIEAIPPNEGTTLPPEQWTPDLAKIAARKISTFAQPAETIELFRDEQILLPVEILVERAQIPEDDAYHQALATTLNTYTYLDAPIVVHGDTWLNNIIVKHDGSDALFIDWDLAGAGYKGQDAGRTLWGLTLDRDWNLAEVNDAAQAFINEWCKTEDDTINLRFGVAFESLRWIADRQDKLKDATLDDDTIFSLSEQIDSVKQHALKVFNYIRPN
jgi:aminoglycoside phosphotransferase (APT) family kinase protein